MTAGRRRPVLGLLLVGLAGSVLGGLRVGADQRAGGARSASPPTVGSAQVNVPAGPAPGASREEIVQGFLAAMEAFPVSTEVAATFLTESAQQRWRPQLRTVVYDDPRWRALPGRRVAVEPARRSRA